MPYKIFQQKHNELFTEFKNEMEELELKNSFLEMILRDKEETINYLRKQLVTSYIEKTKLLEATGYIDRHCVRKDELYNVLKIIDIDAICEEIKGK